MTQNFRIRMLGGQYATPMTCKEANCEAYLHGWVMALDVSTTAHAEFANWVKQKAGRRFFEWRAPYALEEALRCEAVSVTPELKAMLESLAVGMVVLAFPAEQTCFKQHADREVVFSHDKFIHTRPLDFNQDWNEQADRVNTALRRG